VTRTIFFRYGESRLDAGECAKGREAEDDDKNFSHFHFPVCLMEFVMRDWLVGLFQFPDFGSDDCCRLPEPDGFLVWDGLAKARDSAFPGRRRLQRRILLNPEALLQLAGKNRPTRILNVGTRSRVAKNVGLTFHVSG
jgi:hypothetical protein